jgi:hypothetical protein
MSIDDAARQVALAGKMDEYRKQRDARSNTLEDHITLARWCAKQGLKEAERGELIMMLQKDPSNKEAFMKLGLTRKNGQLITPQQLELLKAANKNASDSFARWLPEFCKLRRQYETIPRDREHVLQEIRNLRDIDGIPSMENAFANADEPVELAVVDALKTMTQQVGTAELTRFYVFSSNDAVRGAAAGALRYRARENFVPLLLNALQAPLEASVDYDDRGVTHISISQEKFASKSVFTFNWMYFGWSESRGKLWYAKDRNAIQNRVDDLNELTDQQNKRVISLLANLAGENRGAEANDWWNWWLDVNEYEPLEKETEVKSVPIMRGSCFVRGTPVCTSTGPIAIEKIKPGEIVLSQNPVTGELAYKPVLATTLRRPSPLVEVQIGASTIRGTRGHPYWVCGEGWLMAKELKAGQMLHTVNGPMQIESATQSGEEACYNLIVADFNTYFIDDAKVLVHDNTLRGPNTIRVPGLMEN